MKMQIRDEMRAVIHTTDRMLKLSPVISETESLSLEYAHKSASMGKQMTQPDANRERERMKEQLLPFVKETVKKMLKEEREYYKSRPSQAARQFQSILGTGNIQNILAPAVAGKVYEKIEERARWEWLRKGR